MPSWGIPALGAFALLVVLVTVVILARKVGASGEREAAAKDANKDLRDAHEITRRPVPTARDDIDDLLRK